MVTKRQLGFGFVIAGFISAILLLMVDLFGAGKFSGFGPAQRLALFVSGLVILFGMSLLPFGNRPA